ncbi:hypothetical protein H8E52_06510 [bacterium]|nr:hypothetical protein [bacterium]
MYRLKVPRSRRSIAFLIPLLVILLYGCGTNSSGPSDEDIEPIELIAEEPPFNLLGIEAEFYSNVSYGPHDRNVFDFFLVESEEPTPLVIFIHGGGFVAGFKEIIYINGRAEILECLYNGVSFATINYRFLEPVDTDGVLKCMGDSQRCLQFLRYHHEQLNIDPSRVAIYGVSGGAGTGLWLAFNDDMADPSATDPILRESTRLSAVGAKATQATYDFEKWISVVYAPLGMTMEDMISLPDTSEQSMMSFYGISSIEELDDPEIVEYRARVDMLALMSSDDPGFWVNNNVETTEMPVDLGELQHHGLQALALADRADEVGLGYQAYVPAYEVADPSDDSVVDFLLDRLID